MVIRLGIIGLSADQSAWATATHAVPLKQSPLSERYKITALATSSPESAKHAAKAHGVSSEKAYSNPEDIANDKDVDMVVVSVKVAMHKQLTMPALKAKKDVFVEWPLGANLAQAEEMTALAKSQGVKNIVGLQARQSAIVLKAKDIIDSGALGRIVATNMIAFTSAIFTLPAKAVYMNDPNSGASMISIPVIHCLDPLCFLLGEFKFLNAIMAMKFPEVQFQNADGKGTTSMPRNFVDSVAVAGVLKTGPFVNFSYNITTPATPDHLTWIISGEKASLKFEGDNAAIQMASMTLSMYTSPSRGGGSMYEEPKKAAWDTIEYPESKSFGGVGEVYQAFAEGKTEALVDFEEATKRHRMIDAIVRSAEKGTRESYES